jgi:hypothetical protein
MQKGLLQYVTVPRQAATGEPENLPIFSGERCLLPGIEASSNKSTLDSTDGLLDKARSHQT